MTGVVEQSTLYLTVVQLNVILIAHLTNFVVLPMGFAGTPRHTVHVTDASTTRVSRSDQLMSLIAIADIDYWM